MVLSVLASLVVWAALAVTGLRLFQGAGGTVAVNKGTNWVLGTKYIGGEMQKAGKKELAIVFTNAFVFRLFFFGLSILILYLFTEQELKSFDHILRILERWDATNYVRIATGGDAGHVENGDYTMLPFFPLYPWLMRLFALVFRSPQLAGFVISFLSYAGGCCFLYQLGVMEYGKKTAGKAIIFLSLFPFGFYFGLIMTEGLFFLLTAMGLYFIRRHQWLLVGICGAFAAMTRISGILILVPAVAEFIEHYRMVDFFREKRWRKERILSYYKILLIGIAFLGIFVYLYCNYRTTGNWFQFLEYQQKYWGSHGCYFGEGLSVISRHAFGPNIPIMERLANWIPLVAIVLLALSLMLYGMRRGRTMYMFYFITYFIVNFSVTWPYSGARYLSCAIPMFLFLAEWSEEHPRLGSWLTIIFAVLMGVYFAGYTLGLEIM